MNAWRLVGVTLFLLSCAARSPSAAKTNAAKHPRKAATTNTEISAESDFSRGRHWLFWGTPQRDEARGLLLPSLTREPRRFPGMRQGTWSPDGSLFVSCQADSLSTFRVGQEGPIALEPVSLPCGATSWAPNGHGLLVRHDRMGAQWTWFSDPAAPETRAPFELRRRYHWPQADWAANGAHVIFKNSRLALDLATFPPAGQPINVVPLQANQSGGWLSCAWSPVGSMFACVVRSSKKGVRGVTIADGFKIVVRDADQPNEPAIEVAHLRTIGVPNHLTWVGTKWLAFGLPPKSDSSRPSSPWGSLHVVRVAPGSTPTLLEDSTFVWAAKPGADSTLAYVGGCPAHGACLVEFGDSGPSSPRLVARGEFSSLSWSKAGDRLLIREYKSLRLLENPADRSAKAVLVARAAADMRIDGNFTPDAQWLEVITMRRAYLVSQPGPTMQREPVRNRPELSLWNIAKRVLTRLEFSGDALPFKRFWAPDDTSFAFLIWREKSFELSLLQIRDGKPLAPRRLDAGRDLHDAWVSWQPKSQSD